MYESAYKDIPYGPHERNVLDLYLVPSDNPLPLYVFIHGGGFRSGDKTGIPPELLEALLQNNIHVAAVNYRLSGTDPYPAAMKDCVRALQFIRYRSEEWNIDKTRVAAGGGSAGGGITFWIGYRHNLAKPDSNDPVERESTKLTCIGSWNTQSSYDPNYIRTIIPGLAFEHTALQEFFRVIPEEFETERAKKIFEEVSALNYISEAALPTFIWYPLRNIMDPELPHEYGIHHPLFGKVLKEKMDTFGAECVIRYREDLPDDLSDDNVRVEYFNELAEFVKNHLYT